MDDLIRREDAIKWFEPYADRGLKIPVESVIQNLKDIPSFEPAIEIDARQLAKLLREGWTIHSEPKQGEWIDNGDCEYLCSECGMSLLFEPHYNFCPNCGARMKGADDDAD